MKNSLTSHFIKGLLIVFISLFSISAASAQDQTIATTSSWENPMLLALSAMSAILVLVIFAMGALLKSVLELKYTDKKAKGKTAFNNTTPLVILILFVLFTNSSFAQEAKVVEQAISYGGINSGVFYLFVTIISLELIIIAFFYYMIMQTLKVGVVKEEVKKVTLIEKLNASVAIENEKDIMLDHNYDGIRELDNDLPPWWKYGFYLTIVFAVVYLVIYHVTGSGKLQLAEYEEQLTTADAQIEAYKKKTANNVDENNVTLLTDESSINAGKTVFMANCVACHGQQGQGSVGPNLTDKYWLHGGSVKDIFKSVKYGWPEKGMKSWQKDLGAKQIHELTSFIISLKGTNPPNAKEKQGEEYEEEPETAVIEDSVKADIPSK